MCSSLLRGVAYEDGQFPQGHDLGCNPGFDLEAPASLKWAVLSSCAICNSYGAGGQQKGLQYNGEAA